MIKSSLRTTGPRLSWRPAPSLNSSTRSLSPAIKTALLIAFLWIASNFALAQTPKFQTQRPLSFTKVYEGANPLPQELTLASAGSAFDFSVSTTNSTGGNWLSLSVNSNCCYATPQAVSVTVNPDVTLAAGTYSAQIAAKSSDGTQSQVIPVTLTIESASATFFDDLPGALTFSMLTKSSAPPQQLVPIRNAGAGSLSFTASSTTADGGSWITLSATSGSAPYSLSVGVNPQNLPGQGLSAGTFTGQVLIKTGSDSVSIPVTFTVGASVFRQVNSLSFTKAYEGGNPLPQQITFAGTGSSLNFFVSTANSTGGNWLSLNVNSNCCYATPQAVSVYVNPAATLAAGTYSAQITATSSDGTQFQVVPVTLTIESPSVAFFDDLPGELTFSIETKGSAPPQQVVPIRNAGSSALSFTASSTTSDGAGWITLSATSGTAPYVLSVGVNPQNLPGQGLSAGTFTGQVLLKTGNDIVTVPVTVTVGDSVFRQVNSLNFTKVYEGADPLPQQITFAGTGSSFDFYVRTANSTGGDWLSVSVNSNCCYATPQAVSVSANPDVTLAAGTYSAQIIATSSDGTQSQVIPVTLSIEPPSAAFFDDLPGQLTFSMLTKGSAPPQQLIPIRNAGEGSLSFTASATTADGASWITLSATSGTAPHLISVGINPQNLPGQGLSAGTFTGQVLLKAGSDTVTVPVTVTVGGSVFRQVNSLSFSKVYEAANPLPQEITFASTGSNFDFHVSTANSTGGTWLSVSVNANCCYATSQAVSVAVTPDITLAAGTYSAQIVATSSDGTQSQVIPVTLTIAATSTSSFDDLPGGLTFSGPANGASLSTLPLPIRNAGPGTLNWFATPTTADGGSWLQLNVSSGAAPATPTVSIVPANLPGKGLSAGTFTGQILLQSAEGNVTVPVTVVLGSPVFAQLNPLSFSKSYQGANPSAQTITLASTGSSFNFYVSTANSTGGNWLSVSVNSNCCYATPQAVTVSVNPAGNLTAGVYSAQITATSSDGTKSLVIPVTLTINGSSQTATPTFTPAPGSYSTAQTVALSSATKDAAIYYTTDGSTPTTSSTKYSSAFSVNKTETIKAIALAPGFPQSAVASGTYTLTGPTAATPAATQTITISEATANVTVYYTTNGTTPTTSSTKYTGPITLTASSVLKFIAIGPNYAASAVRTVSTTIQ